MKRTKLRKRSLNTLPKLKAKAEKLFHAWICKRDRGVCFTCGKQGNQAGHFLHGKLDFEPLNLHCQCAGCNHYKSGNLGMYAIRLIDNYGQVIVDDLIYRSNQVHKYTRDELEKIIEKYK